MPDATTALQILGGTAPTGGPASAAPIVTTPSNIAPPALPDDTSSAAAPSNSPQDGSIDQKLAILSGALKVPKTSAPATPAAASGDSSTSSSSIAKMLPPGPLQALFSLGSNKQAQQSTLGDVAMSVPAGLVSGIENAPMVPAQVGNLAFHYGIVDPVKLAYSMNGTPLSAEQKAKIDAIQPLPNTPEQAGARIAGAVNNVVSDNKVSNQDVQQIEQSIPTLGEMIHTPTTTGGQYANTVSQFVGGGKTMGIGNAAVPPGGAGPTLGQQVSAAAPLVAAGVGSETGGQIFKGSDLENAARLVGGGLGGFAYEGGARGAQALTGVAQRTLAPMGIGPKEEVIPSQNGAPGLSATDAQQQIAGQKIMESARNPDQVQQTLAQYDQPTGPQSPWQATPALAPGELVAGSKPTLAETTLDPGLIQWQDALRSKNRDAFLSRSSDQNAARNQAISSVGGIGNPEAVGQFFGDQLKSLDEGTQANVAGATNDLQNQTENLGGRDTPQQYGQQIREQLEGSAAGSKAQLNGLWNVLKPYNDVQINGTPAVTAARSILGSVDEGAGQSLTPNESSIFNAVSNWTDHPTFGRLKTLRSEIADAQRQLRVTYGNESQPMRRMGMMKTAVDQTINDAVTGISHVENHAIEAGQLAPENSIEGKLAALREQFYADRKSNAATARANAQKGPLGDAFRNGPSTVSGVGEAASGGDGGSGPVAGDQGLRGNPPGSKINVNLSAAGDSIPGIKKLAEAAANGDASAHATLNQIAKNHLEHLTSEIPGAQVHADSNTGVYGGSTEPSIGASVHFPEESRGKVLSSLAKFADNFNQDQIHVLEDTKGLPGQKFSDGSYNTPTFRMGLKRPLTTPELNDIIESSGLKGLTANDKYLEAYHVGDPNNEAARQQFENSVIRAHQKLGELGVDNEQYSEALQRLRIYGNGDGAIPYDQIAGDVRTKKPGEDKNARLIAERQTGTPIEGAEQTPVTPEQAAKQERIAADYEKLPLNDMANPLVKRSYEALAREMQKQYADLPIKVDVWKGEGEPYKNSEAMRRDVQDNNHLYINKTTPETFGPRGQDYSAHPLLKESGFKSANGEPLLNNDIFRAVHDYYAHNITPSEFGPAGEEAAWKNHIETIKSPLARWALTSETRGQNSWVNFNKNVKSGTPLSERPFAPQKAALLPVEHALTGNDAIDAPMHEMISHLKPQDRLGSLGKSSFDEAGQKAYDAARADTIRHKETFRNGPVGKALKEGRAGAQYSVPDSSIATSFFNAKDVSPENIQAYHKAVGGKVEAMNLLQDAAASDLRAKAINPDGTINPTAFNRWTKAHAKAIAAFPELKQNLDSVKNAQDFLTTKLAERKTAMDDFNKSRAATFIGADPIVAVRKAFGADNSTKTFGDLVDRVKSDPGAAAGLKRAAADYLLQEVRGAEKGDTVSLDLRDPKAFRKFVGKNSDALRTLFGGQGINNLERVVADMRRSSMITKGAKIPGQSNTTQDALAVSKQSNIESKSVFGRIRDAMGEHSSGLGGAAAGFAIGGPHGAVMGAALEPIAKIAKSMRAAGLKTIDQLQLEAALNPQLANELVKKATAAKIPVPVQNRIGAQLLKIIPIAEAHRVKPENEQ